ncbi:MAG: RsmD family RNA methyltransferase, partial [Gemmatimonadetes bacterium]|nr:RsmD family RNA methyltransferase [Gemmatimonadota bacterium]
RTGWGLSRNRDSDASPSIQPRHSASRLPNSPNREIWSIRKVATPKVDATEVGSGCSGLASTKKATTVSWGIAAGNGGGMAAAGALRAIRANAELLDAASEVEILSGDAMEYVSRLGAGSFDLALADPPYGKGFAASLIERFEATAFASQLWVEHRTTDATPDPPGLRQRRYGDTLISIVEAKS